MAAEDKAVVDSVVVSLMALVAVLWHSVTAELGLLYAQGDLVYPMLLGNYWELGEMSQETVVETLAHMELYSAVMSD